MAKKSMNRNRVVYLHQRYVNRKITAAELEEFRQALEHPETEAILHALSDENWDTLKAADLQDINAHKSDEIFSGIVNKPQEQYLRVKLWPRMAISIAAALAVVVFGVWLYYASAPRHAEFISVSPNYANDVKPGKNTATLTLANGKTIALSEAKTGVVINASSLSYSDGTAITSSLPTSPSLRGGTHEPSSGQAVRQSPDEVATARAELGSVSPSAPRNDVMVKTPRGGQYQVLLPDGTKVWLNADSRISFPSRFIGKERKVLIKGEVYFEVAKDSKHPFVVSTEGQDIEVLGTHFNVAAYEDEKSIKTTLLEGSLRVSPLLAGKPVLLKPGQQATRTGKGIDVIDVHAEDAVAWKDGLFVFEDEPLEQIMRRIARWYNVEVVYDEGLNRSKRYWGTVSRYEHVSNVLDVLQSTKNIHFKVEERRIRVMK